MSDKKTRRPGDFGWQETAPASLRQPGDGRSATANEEHVGPYRILNEIGHGGMGSVYLADRADGQFRKRVAIKVAGS